MRKDKHKGMLQYMQPFETEYVPKVLLTGNGLHRAFENDNWDKLLKEIALGDFSEDEWEKIKELPYPQIAIVATGNHVAQGMEKVSEKYIDLSPLPGEQELIRNAVQCGFDAILTTNYSYEIEKALSPDFQVAVRRPSKYRRKTCQDKPRGETSALYKYIFLPGGAEEVPIWHIHGEAALPDTMIIGHYYYGKLLSKMQSYSAEAIKRFRIAERYGGQFYPRSWVDYLLFGDIFIVGQGMDQSELDLWWLMDCKKRNGKGEVFLYKPDMPDAQRMLAEVCGVNVRTCSKPTDYVEYYKKVFTEVKIFHRD